MYRINKIIHPEIFQGKYQKKHYFEGWYFKVIDSNMEHALAIIPGISIEEKDTHAFIQVLNHESKAEYIRYEITDFRYNEKKFEFEIGENYFSHGLIRLNIVGNELSIKGQLQFHNVIKLPKTILRPGIMGPFSYIPYMECYHGIVSIHHDITGQLNITGKQVDFCNGYGYTEKDWGRSFPENWVWFQSNHFGKDDVTLMFSVAKIPCLGSAFTGFLSFLRLKKRIYVFATYTGAKIRKLDYNKENVRVIVQDLRFRLEMKVTFALGGNLRAPKDGLMKRDIIESINAVAKVKFTDRSGNIIYKGEGTNTGLEIV